MLSEVHLKLPHSAGKKKKQNNVVLQYDPYVDRNSYKTIQDREAKTPRFRPKEQPQENYSTVFCVPQKTRNSSQEPQKQTHREYKTRDELIKEWTIEYMQKKNILGVHW